MFWTLLLLFSCWIVSDSLWLLWLQHTKLLCPSLSPEVCSNWCPLSQWCHPNISSSVPVLHLSSIFPSIRVFCNESTLHIRWPKYWSFSFSISPSDWLVWSPCCPRDSRESSPAPQFESIISSVFSLLYGPTLTCMHDYWKSLTPNPWINQGNDPHWRMFIILWVCSASEQIIGDSWDMQGDPDSVLKSQVSAASMSIHITYTEW